MAGNGTGGLQRGAMNAQAILCSGSEMFAASRRLVCLLPSAPLLRAFKGGPRACAERAGMALGCAVVSSPQRVIASRRRQRSHPLTAPPPQAAKPSPHRATTAGGEAIPSPRHRRSRSKHSVIARPAQPVEALCHCETGAAGRSNPASPAGVRGHYKTAAGGEAIPSPRHRRMRRSDPLTAPPPHAAKPSPHPLPLSRARERGDRRRARDRPTVSVPMFARGFGPPLKRR
jgi:hypothetical protein